MAISEVKCQEACIPFMLSSKRRLSTLGVQYRYDKRRNLNVTERAGTMKPTVLLRSSLSKMKTVTGSRGGED
jgi:hypothetical protein